MKSTQLAHKSKPVTKQSKHSRETKEDRKRFERARKALYEYWKDQ